jgi:hypothetical protein
MRQAQTGRWETQDRLKWKARDTNKIVVGRESQREVVYLDLPRARALLYEQCFIEKETECGKEGG